MTTPICDFVRQYADGNPLRLHMPGHKGRGEVERLDITEIPGADALYEASGIIAESERNASALFGADTFYSTEGSSLCIRAMMYLALLYARERGRRPLIAAARNVHKSFVSAAALLDLDIVWLYGAQNAGYFSCDLSPTAVEQAFSGLSELPVALYLTSPDYLGHSADVAGLAQVCHRYGVLLLVDNAHGAYLRFLSPSRHPIDLGADACCDSAHKTLPVLTGGAYLHFAPDAPSVMRSNARAALTLFGSTSPSYLILQSLDAANCYISDGYGEKMLLFSSRIHELKKRLTEKGYALYGDEVLKTTIVSKKYGYKGYELAQKMADFGVVCEFADEDFAVMMLSPEMEEAELMRLEKALMAIPRRAALARSAPKLPQLQRALTLREAILSPKQVLPLEQCEGRVLGDLSVGCPPAVPIAVCGERLTAAALACYRYYGFDSCVVVSEK